MPQDKVVLVAGASGVVGQAAVEHFLSEPRTKVIALSRRRPAIDDEALVHVPVDLRDAAQTRGVLAGLPAPTHLVFAALYEKPDLVAGWRDPEQMDINLAMLRHVIEPLLQRGRLQHVTLLQGTKAYGVHLHRIAVPARERWPRDPHDNFYWLQEDYLRDQTSRHGFTFTILRPQIIFGDAVGVAMNLAPVIGVYAAICKEEDQPFGFPGGASYLLEAVDAGLLARAIAWAGDAPAARGETFNVTNGDVFAWRNVWPTIAAALSVEPGPDTPLALTHFFDHQADVWDCIAWTHALSERDLPALLGHSHLYADFCFAYGARSDPPPVLVSTIKLRQAGFVDCMDTEDMFRALFAKLRAKRILPTY